MRTRQLFAILLLLISLCAIGDDDISVRTRNADRGIATGANLLAKALDRFADVLTKNKEPELELGRVTAVKKILDTMSLDLYQLTQTNKVGMSQQAIQALNAAVSKLRVASRGNHFTGAESLSKLIHQISSELKDKLDLKDLKSNKTSLWGKLKASPQEAAKFGYFHDAALSAMARITSDCILGLKVSRTAVARTPLDEAARFLTDMGMHTPNTPLKAAASINTATSEKFWQGVESLTKDYLEIMTASRFEFGKEFRAADAGRAYFADVRQISQAFLSYESMDETQILVEVDPPESIIEKLQLLNSPSPLCERILAKGNITITSHAH